MSDNEDLTDLDTTRLDALLRQASALPREQTPDADAWPAIKARIEAGRVRAISDAPKPTPQPRRFWHSHRLAWGVAATMLVVLSGVVYRNARIAPSLDEGSRVSDARAGDTGASATFTAAAALTTDASESIARAIGRYDAAANDLAGALAEKKHRLDPQTAAVLDSCIRKIDDAIAEARSALATDPKNAIIADMLQSTYQQKIDLLKRAADLPLRKL